MTSTAQNITRHFQGEWHGSYGAIPTPGHSARDRGLTVKDGENGEPVFYAHNDVSFDWRGMKDECRKLGLMPDRMASAEWRETGSYTYRAASGATLYRTVRKERAGAGKRFEAQRLESGRWIGKLDRVERVPYRLPELLAADPVEPVYFVEGERKADKLAGWGMVATAIAFGCKGWRREYAQHFTGRTVVILPDNDDVGREFAAKVKQALDGTARAVVIIPLPGVPDRGDIIDWRGSADDLRMLTAVALNPPVETFPIADLAGWSRTTATPKTFLMAGFVPARELTLATGAGGANKSTFGQQLATCCAAGVPMLGVEVVQGAALYITAEDDEDRLHWMQEHICRAVGVGMASLAGKLSVASLRGRLGNELATFDNEGKLRPSPSFALLKATIAQSGAQLVVLDNAAHLFAGNENDRGQVTAFVNLLYSLCVDLGVTIMLVAHANKAGDSYSGSTAWLNAVRSQIVLARPEGAMDPDQRVLTLGKANYARPGEELHFRWHDFALRLDTDLPADQRNELAATAAAATANARFLELLDKSRDERRAVSASRAARNFAPRIFAGMTGAKGMKDTAFEGALERLLHLGAVVAEGRVYQRENRSWVTGIVRSESAPTIAPTMHRPPAPTRTEQLHQPAPSTHPYTTYRAGAALEGPPPAVTERHGSMLNGLASASAMTSHATISISHSRGD
jgi:RecA-family ATPase